MVTEIHEGTNSLNNNINDWTTYGITEITEDAILVCAGIWWYSDYKNRDYELYVIKNQFWGYIRIKELNKW